ncbi:winged helix-turn-helix domain-containing protein [Streptomyces sp. NEAU-sy36]|uniref:BTAD domain-containing putative transcriptional regulator n=1 Tax=unclassified Streptomyces TaxID=2593676 RepID=UPI0015D6361F|nr:MULTISPECIES: BTAD domain-containing putative transcriptional regulator [unclassified Streptomyces]QLJ00715.1 winged helix-turn-helix domain-containing protein [Streptomyces sp. NEAU-sy36]
MNPVRYRLLGPTQAFRPDGTAVPVGGARLRALLSVLALRAGRTVPSGVLVDEVWGADPPADAAGALQALVGRLRRALGADAVASAEGGYRLAAAAEDVDLTRFDRLTGDGLAALAEGDAPKAAALLDDALALWHGPALADLPDHTAEAARWETRRLDARRARLTAALALGQAETALPELTALCDAHPLDEPLQALRLRALRDLGRPAQALAAYEDVRRLIADRLGSDPGPELRALHARLLVPDDDGQPGPPRTARGTNPGRGRAGGRRGMDAGSHVNDRDASGGRYGGDGPDDATGRYGPGAPDGSDGRYGAGGPGGAGGRYGDGGPDGSAGRYGGEDRGGRGDSGGDGGFGGSSGRYGHDGRHGPAGPDGSTGRYGDEDRGGRGDSGGDGGFGDFDGSSGRYGRDGRYGDGGPAGSTGRYGDEDRGGRGDFDGDGGFGGSSGRYGRDGRYGAGGPGGPGGRYGEGVAAGHGESAGPDGRYGDGGPDGPTGRYGDGDRGGRGDSGGDGGFGDFGGSSGRYGRDGRYGDGGPDGPGGRYGEGVPGGLDGSGGPDGRYGDGGPDGRGGSGGPSGHGGRAGGSGQGNIPARLTSFVGREADLAAIGADLGTARLVTLLGPGGAGKTRLSQEAAEAVRDSVRDGVWLAELAPVDDPDAVPQAVLTAIGARETVLHGVGAESMRAVVEGHDPLDRLVEHCARRRMLIVLDNCEHVVDAAARLAERLLERCPGLTVLATSREPLGVPGELVRPVEPLPEPVALRLFADRGAAARPGFRVEDDPEACAEICRRLDGLPLAIELAAARLRMLSPRQIADRLDDRFRLLTSGSRTVLPRQQTLRAVVDWSWDLLDADERDVLAGLSVFAGGCDLAAAEAVCGPVALEAVGSLVDKSLVVAAPSADGTMRYRLLETVAEYAAERLAESGRRTETERAHLTYYRELARTTDPLLRGPEQRAAIARIQLEYENLRTALRHAVAARDEQEALCLVLSLVWFWQMRDQRIEARTWCREVMTLGPDPFTEPVRRAEPVWRRCTETPPPYSGELLHEARRGLHLAHMACMDTELDAWQSPEALAKLRTVAKVYSPGMPQTCRAPGMVWFFAVMLTGGAERMRTIVDANVRTCRETPGFEWELAGALQWRANLLANRSAWAGDAARDADEALALYRRLGDDWGTAEALSARGEARERKGAYQEAALDYRAAVEHAERLGARAQTAVLSARLGSVLMESGELEEGERLLREVVASQENTHSEAMPAARLFLACWLGLTGRTGEAREQIRLLREEFRVSNFVVFDAVILCQEALLDALDGREEEALGRVRTAIRHAEDPLAEAVTPQLPSIALTTGAMALARAGSGARAADAARALAAADALLPTGHILSGMEQRARAMAEERIREALDERAYRAAYAEGGGLSLAEATALL